MPSNEHRELVELIRSSFGMEIANEAEQLLQSGQHHELPFLDLVTLAERKHYERQAQRTMEELGREKTASRINFENP
ncbi:MAG: hypothetical protein J5I93_22445 [Pirellulaceae bacterium]|nr:hypothetical protein [Pirellulaceae bacterium]